MEPLRVYHLQTHKVVSYDKTSSMPNIESILVKLAGILSLKKHCLFLKQERLISNKPPYIKTVLIGGKDAGEDEKRTAQAIMDEILKPADKKLSYKEAFEEQEKRSIELEKRLAALEVPQGSQGEIFEGEPLSYKPISERDILTQKANELNITFRSNLGNEKLLLKIQDIEPEFQI